MPGCLVFFVVFRLSCIETCDFGHAFVVLICHQACCLLDLLPENPLSSTSSSAWRMSVPHVFAWAKGMITTTSWRRVFSLMFRFHRTAGCFGNLSVRRSFIIEQSALANANCAVVVIGLAKDSSCWLGVSMTFSWNDGKPNSRMQFGFRRSLK